MQIPMSIVPSNAWHPSTNKFVKNERQRKQTIYMFPYVYSPKQGMVPLL